MIRAILLLSLLFSFNTFALEEIKIAPQFYRTSSEKQESMKETEALFAFKFVTLNADLANSSIIYSIDDEQNTVTLDSFKFEVKSTPGKHVFKIYVNGDYLEMYSDSLSIDGGFKDNYSLFPHTAYQIYSVDKPVIYLYPEKKQEVKVEVVPVGELQFTYPSYESGWNVTAHPDGTIEHNGKAYNYLFWEANQKASTFSLLQHGGFVVEKSKVVSFLEEKLDLAGFTSKEKADFITYWGPRMIQHHKLLVEFIQNEDCDQFAQLGITPQPNHVNRFYMSWGPITSDVIIEAQEIIPMNREGFSALEWGGQQVIMEEIPDNI